VRNPRLPAKHPPPARATSRGRRVRIPDRRASALATGPGLAPRGAAGRPRQRRTARSGAAGQARPAPGPAGSRGRLLLPRRPRRSRRPSARACPAAGGRSSRSCGIVPLRGIGTSGKVCHLAPAKDGPDLNRTGGLLRLRSWPKIVTFMVHRRLAAGSGMSGHVAGGARQLRGPLRQLSGGSGVSDTWTKCTRTLRRAPPPTPRAR